MNQGGNVGQCHPAALAERDSDLLLHLVQHASHLAAGSGLPGLDKIEGLHSAVLLRIVRAMEGSLQHLGGSLIAEGAFSCDLL
jgi:hypothetical protein